MACPGCGAETARVHGYHERTAADVPVDGRRVLVKVRVRRMRCPVLGCTVQTFREQVSGVLDRYQRRITRLAGQVSAVVRELAGRASARLLPALGIGVSRHTALRALLRDPPSRPGGTAGPGDRRLRAAPRPGLRDRADRRRDRPARRRRPGPHRRRRGEMAAGPSRGRGRVPGRVGCLRRGRPPGAARRGAGRRPLAPVARPRRGRPRRKSPRTRACWAEGRPAAGGQARRDHRWSAGSRSTTCAPGASACSSAPAAWACRSTRSSATTAPASRERLQRAPKYRPTLVDPYRDYLRKRRAEEPGVPVQQLLREIRELGYQGSSNLLVRYINQGRVEATGRTCHPAGPPGSCSPGRTTSPPASTRRWPAHQPPARR